MKKGILNTVNKPVLGANMGWMWLVPAKIHVEIWLPM